MDKDQGSMTRMIPEDEALAMVGAAYEAAAKKVLAMQKEFDETNERFAKAKAAGVCIDYEADDYAAATRKLKEDRE
jgi:hypothetical protein